MATTSTHGAGCCSWRAAACTPTRGPGTVTRHDARVVHGVSALTGGVRYGLFFLCKPLAG